MIEATDLLTGKIVKAKPKKTFLSHRRKSFLAVPHGEISSVNGTKALSNSKIALWRGNISKDGVLDINHVYLGTGCCAGITGEHANSNSDTFYGIVINTADCLLSVAKIVKYVEELNSIGFKMEVYETYTKDKNTIIYYGRPQRLSGGATFHNQESPGPFKIMVVRIYPTTSLQLLMYGQLLRQLTMGMYVNLNAKNPNSQTNTVVYQPQLYFRLRNLFPEVSPYIILWASHILHGAAATSTYHIWYDMFTNPRSIDKALPTVGSMSINAAFSNGSINNICIDVTESRIKLQELYKQKKYKEAFEALIGFHKIKI